MVPLRELVLWLDAETARYWMLAGLSFALCVLLAWQPGHRKTAPWFALSVLLTLSAFRWPSWFYPLDLNPDEAQIVAGALTLDRFPVMWKYLDTTTHGPLCEYALVLASWLGAPFNYVTARILAVLLQAGTLLAVWGTLRLFAPEGLARIGILPGLAFWSLVSWDDFLHYSSELPGLCLLAVGTWGVAKTLVALLDGGHPWRWPLFAGFCLGAVPFGKLQSAPQMAVTALLALGILWRLTRSQPGARRSLAFLLGGLATPTLIVGVYLLVYGQTAQFWYTYIQSAIDFLAMAPHPFAAMPGRFLHFSATSPAFAWFFWGTLGFALLYARGDGTAGGLRSAVFISWVLTAAALFGVLRPARETVHYLHLLVAPLTLLAGFTFARVEALMAADTPAGFWRRSAPLLSFVLLTLAPQIYDRTVTFHRFAGHVAEYISRPKSAAARFILERAQPRESMAMWGWAPHLLVEVQMPHGTREAQSGNQLMQWPMTHFFVDRYVADMQRTKPAWFVDTVGPGAFIFADRATMGHESIPQLRQLISVEYELLAEIDQKRIYRLRRSPH